MVRVNSRVRVNFRVWARVRIRVSWGANLKKVWETVTEFAIPFFGSYFFTYLAKTHY
jgi:hypothetical protein